MDLSSYLPSATFRYTLGAIAIAALFVGLAVAISREPEPAPIAVIANNSIVSSESSADTDGDGLKDWEEDLIGTSKENSDTDGDTTSDGEEVAQGRDPLLKAPNDKVSGGNIAASGSVSASTSATELFARQVFAKYSAGQGSGTGFTDGDLQNLVNAALAAPTSEKGRFYTQSDLKTSENSSLTSLKEYGNAMGAVLKKHPAGKGDSELTIFERALRTEQESELAKLGPIINKYQAILDDMLNVRVPKDLVGAHLDVLNGVSRVLANIRGMQKVFEDPVVGMQAFSQYPKNIDLMVSAFTTTAALLENKGVSFESTETGALFMNVF